MVEPAIMLRLLGGFELKYDGEVASLAGSAEHVLAFLALQERAVQRPFVAGHLWPNVSEARAQANLRCALWRLHSCGLHLLYKSAGKLALSSSVWVDVREASTHANKLLEGANDLQASVALLSCELLPDWYDDWVLLERERLRELYLHALDVLALRQIDAGNHAAAVIAALAAVHGDPLRESVRRTLMRAQLAEGNTAGAIHQYFSFRHLLRSEVGIEPGPEIAALLSAATARGHDTAEEPTAHRARFRGAAYSAHMP